MTQPLARKQPSPKTAALTLVVLWSVAALVALAPLAKGYFGDEFYGNNGVCLPLHIHDPYAMVSGIIKHCNIILLNCVNDFA